MLRLHACSVAHVRCVSFDLQEVYMFLAVGGTVVSGMIDIVPTRKTVKQVHVLFGRI